MIPTDPTANVALPPDDSAVLESVPWDDLLLAIRDKNLLPVIGPALVTVTVNGRTMPFTDWLVPEFMKNLGMDDCGDLKSLNEVVRCYLDRERKQEVDIYGTIRKLVENYKDLPVPQGLTDLAAIRDFDLFITSTFDGFLAKALCEARPGYKADEGGLAIFRPNRHVDIPKKIPDTFVYHVLGSCRTCPDFALWEEDYMEFLCALLIAPKDNLMNLFTELNNRSLLLIGAPFDDWIVRLFLRIAKQERLSGRRPGIWGYLADKPHLLGEPMIFYFDKIIGSPKIVPLDPARFVAELRRRWEEKYGLRNGDDLLASIPDDMERGSVFISYSHDDKEAAIKFAIGLRAAGVPVWLDRSRLKPGGDWNQTLKMAVQHRCSLFISLISRNTEADDQRFVHTERKWIADVHVAGFVKYIPVIIDDTGKGLLEPGIFSHLHRYRLEAGDVTLEFSKTILAYLAQYKKNGEVRDV